MSGQSGYFKLGLFVISAVVLLVVGVVVLGAGAMFKKTISVETVTTQSVDGLDVGAQVKFRGVNIGTVSKIEPAIWRYRAETPEHHIHLGNQIILELAIDPRTFPATDLNQVRGLIARAADAGLRARVTSSGLTGPSYVEIAFLDPKDYPAMQLAWQPEKPYVPSAPNAMSQVLASLESIATGLKRANLEKVVGHVDELIVGATKAVNDLQMATLRTKVGALLDEVRGSNGRLREVLENPNLDRALQNVSAATGNADLAMVELRRALRELNGLLATQRRDIESAIVNLRRVLENAAALTGDLKDNPSRAVFGQPPPRRRPGE